MSTAKKAEEKKPEDNIDALLDQVERKFFSPEAEKLSKIAPKDCECTKKQETNWEEVDEILKDFVFEDTNPFGKHKNNSWIRRDLNTSDATSGVVVGESSQSQRRKSQDEGLQKCHSLLLAGSYESMGRSEIGHEKPCDNLKCLRCDFKVLCFDNFAWDPTTDYLFLRNSMPDFHKLAVKLDKKKGWRAYSCQCRSLSINKITCVDAKPEVKWVCGKHRAIGKNS